ncbi:hypothetical protein MUP95_01590 [bacterium]|nr:hypothetical protein [bacterium]
MGQYQLKKGVLLQSFGDASKVCTNDNLTDELAEWHLKQSPEKIIYFSKLHPGMQVTIDPPRRPAFLSMKDKTRISTAKTNFQTNIVPPAVIVPPRIVIPPTIVIPKIKIPSPVVEPVKEVVKDEVKKEIKKPSKAKK